MISQEPVFDRFRVKLYAVDDHEEEMKRAIAPLDKLDLVATVENTASEWADLARHADSDTILMSDNYINGLNDLGAVGHDNIDTSNGEKAGLRLLTQFCKVESIKPGLKILLTQFAKPDAREFAVRRRGKGDDLYIFSKNDESDCVELFELIKKFSIERRVEFVRKKIEYSNMIFQGWNLTGEERAGLFGLKGLEDPVWSAMEAGTASSDVETRCDLIYEMKLNLTHAYGVDSLETERRWLHLPLNELQGNSPLGHVLSREVERLFELVAIMKGVT